MLHDERILKNKFAYFFSIIFVLGWIIFYAYNIFKIFLMGYGFKEEYNIIKIPIYILYFIIFPLLIFTFISIFKESKMMFKYLNTSVLLMIIFHLLFFYVRYQKINDSTYYIYSFIIMNVLFILIPVVFINYSKHLPPNNEIEQIGKLQD